MSPQKTYYLLVPILKKLPKGRVQKFTPKSKIKFTAKIREVINDKEKITWGEIVQVWKDLSWLWQERIKKEAEGTYFIEKSHDPKMDYSLLLPYCQSCRQVLFEFKNAEEGQYIVNVLGHWYFIKNQAKNHNGPLIFSLASIPDQTYESFRTNLEDFTYDYLNHLDVSQLRDLSQRLAPRIDRDPNQPVLYLQPWHTSVPIHKFALLFAPEEKVFTVNGILANDNYTIGFDFTNEITKGFNGGEWYGWMEFFGQLFNPWINIDKVQSIFPYHETLSVGKMMYLSSALLPFSDQAKKLPFNNIEKFFMVITFETDSYDRAIIKHVPTGKLEPKDHVAIICLYVRREKKLYEYLYEDTRSGTSSIPLQIQRWVNHWLQTLNLPNQNLEHAKREVPMRVVDTVPERNKRLHILMHLLLWAGNWKIPLKDRVNWAKKESARMQKRFSGASFLQYLSSIVAKHYLPYNRIDNDQFDFERFDQEMEKKARTLDCGIVRDSSGFDIKKSFDQGSYSFIFLVLDAETKKEQILKLEKFFNVYKWIETSNWIERWRRIYREAILHVETHRLFGDRVPKLYHFDFFTPIHHPKMNKLFDEIFTLHMKLPEVATKPEELHWGMFLMEPATGTSLYDIRDQYLIPTTKRKTGPFSTESGFISFIRELAFLIYVLNLNNICHGDLSLKNLLVEDTTSNSCCIRYGSTMDTQYDEKTRILHFSNHMDQSVEHKRFDQVICNRLRLLDFGYSHYVIPDDPQTSLSVLQMLDLQYSKNYSSINFLVESQWLQGKGFWKSLDVWRMGYILLTFSLVSSNGMVQKKSALAKRDLLGYVQGVITEACSSKKGKTPKHLTTFSPPIFQLARHFLTPFLSSLTPPAEMNIYCLRFLTVLLSTPLYIMLVNDICDRIHGQTPSSVIELVERYYLPDELKEVTPDKFILYREEFFKLSYMGTFLCQPTLVSCYKSLLEELYQHIQKEAVPIILNWSNLKPNSSFAKNFWHYICQCISWTDGNSRHKLDWLLNEPIVFK